MDDKKKLQVFIHFLTDNSWEMKKKKTLRFERTHLYHQFTKRNWWQIASWISWILSFLPVKIPSFKKYFLILTSWFSEIIPRKFVETTNEVLIEIVHNRYSIFIMSNIQKIIEYKCSSSVKYKFQNA